MRQMQKETDDERAQDRNNEERAKSVQGEMPELRDQHVPDRRIVKVC